MLTKDKYVKIVLKTAFNTKKPEFVIVVGDLNPMLARTLLIAKMRVPLAHIEADLRSYDSDISEEINRLLTDDVSDYLVYPQTKRNLKVFKLADPVNDKDISYIDPIDYFDFLNWRWMLGLS
jgi:UDP-N-acetylglucosamine 2-epimerase